MSIPEKPKVASSLPLMNERIPFARMQLISFDGKNIGEVSRFDALAHAREHGLDLVIIADQGAMGIPVAKAMDFGKALYAKKKQQNEAKKNQKVIQVKEIQIRPKIGEHDLQTKLNAAVRFLEEGKRVKFVLIFHGREKMMQEERGNDLFGKIQAAFEAADLIKRLVQEKDLRVPQAWSRVYYLK